MNTPRHATSRCAKDTSLEWMYPPNTHILTITLPKTSLSSKSYWHWLCSKFPLVIHPFKILLYLCRLSHSYERAKPGGPRRLGGFSTYPILLPVNFCAGDRILDSYNWGDKGSISANAWFPYLTRSYDMTETRIWIFTVLKTYSPTSSIY